MNMFLGELEGFRFCELFAYMIVRVDGIAIHDDDPSKYHLAITFKYNIIVIR